MSAAAQTIANSQAVTRLTVAERTAKLLAFKPRSPFNAPITARSAEWSSAMAKARAAI